MKTSHSQHSPSAAKKGNVEAYSDIAEAVGREILESRLDPADWATALFQCEGKREDALSHYARLRIRKLAKIRQARLSKTKSFESRRLATCMGDSAAIESMFKTVEEMLRSPLRGRTMNFPKPKLSVIWLVILFLGTSGSIAAFGRLHLASIPEDLAPLLRPVALVAGAGSVFAAVLLRFLMPKRVVMLCWKTGLVAACNVVCLGSLLLGTKVIKTAIASGTAPIALQAPAKPASPAPVKPAGAESRYLAAAETGTP